VTSLSDQPRGRPSETGSLHGVSEAAADNASPSSGCRAEANLSCPSSVVLATAATAEAKVTAKSQRKTSQVNRCLADSAVVQEIWVHDC